jgi:hypothetical protein
MALVAAPKGTTPNTLLSYPPGSVIAPASVPASTQGNKNTTGNTTIYQVPS